MKKYIRYLLGDIDALIEQAPAIPVENWLSPDPVDAYQELPLRYVKISQLIGLSTEVFPPEHLLSEGQVIELVEAITDLWTAWLLHWSWPPNLPVRLQYTAFVNEFDGKPIAYHPEEGGDVHICQFSAGKPCPFGETKSTACYCQNADQGMEHEFELWEEYLRSQGLDPDQEITDDEEARFEEEMKHRRTSPNNNTEDLYCLDQDLGVSAELSEKEQQDFLFALEMADEMLSKLLDDLPDNDYDASMDEDEGEFLF